EEEPKLFCVDEHRAVCPVCEFSHHQSHKVVPAEEAVSDLKEQLKSDLKSLQDKRNKYKQVEETYNKVIQHSKKQLLSTERQIRAECCWSDCDPEDMTHICTHRDTFTETRLIFEKQEMPKQSKGVFIIVQVWEKMKEKVHFSPVILDPNTANCCLYLSDDLTRDSKQQLPDNPERYTKYHTLFGSEGFKSGKHSWEVEVGDHPTWIIGLVKESVDKNERFVSPKDGFWCLTHESGEYTNGDGQTVTVKKSLQRIRVQLDYDRGEVSFYDPEDMTHIYTHRDTFTEKLFPYFNVGKAGDSKTSDIKICPTNISL
uniref:B30.2/SPRY domain-containing protein n=1 Tax=Neolamprologus brichardi TaxID=32507 RepID=A0A3Q4MA65_NEOBR